MQGSARRALIAVVLCATVLAVVLHNRGTAAGADGEITPEIRAATLNLGGVAPQDRVWIQNAIATARPEAQRLIAEVDGLVEYKVHHGDPLGVTRSEVSPLHARFEISFDVASLDGQRTQDRAVTVLHEYGHAIDLALVPKDLGEGLEAAIPRNGPCGNYGGVLTGSCAAPAERFADTFAKWALRGSVSVVGAGYQVTNPPSLEDWGAPLVALSNRLAAPR
jgi:hypothetical protein